MSQNAESDSNSPRNNVYDQPQKLMESETEMRVLIFKKIWSLCIDFFHEFFKDCYTWISKIYTIIDITSISFCELVLSHN